MEEDSTDPVSLTNSMTYLYLVLNISPNKDYIVRYRIVLSRLFSVMKLADPDSVIIPYDSHLEYSNSKINNYYGVYIDYLNKLPKSIT